MIKKIFRVEGMHCPNCAMRVESIEETLPGILRAEASYKKGVMVVKYDEKLVGVAEILAAIGKVGYTAEVV